MTADAKVTSVWRGGLILTVLAALCTTIVAVTYNTTAPRIEANEQAYLEARLKPVLGNLEYDGKLSGSTRVIDRPNDLPGKEAVTVYRVYADVTPVAAIFAVTAMDGFSGSIKLLIGIDANGVLTGVRVLEHRETPGLGDLIDESKSDWILQFVGKSLSNPDASAWSIKRDGGEFDQFTGASITPRSVVNAVKETLTYYQKSFDVVFADQDE